MLISPPFLPPITGQADDAWFKLSMSASNGDGPYPVTSGLAWHGGIHLVSPNDRPARAIADGVVSYARKATVKNDNPDDPLNYHAGESVSGWTSDGCVVIEHNTQIGAGQDATVRFFSIYMHLEDIPPSLASGKPIYRKDVIGQAGYINGKPGVIHFEIICDDANLKKLVGRRSGDVDVEKNGRHDAVYGDIYFSLPIGTPIFSSAPAGGAASNAAPGALLHTSSEALFVGIRYAADAHVTTYRADGKIIGLPLLETGGEYNLYKNASNLNTRCPSAAYEMLRFGRVLGTDILDPTQIGHWRKICYRDGEGWVNLAVPAVKKFSDADFPHWQGWALVDDSADMDSHVDADIISWLINPDGVSLSEDQVRKQLNSSLITDKLGRLICKIPTEWNAETIDARWGWLKSQRPGFDNLLSTEDFEQLKRHIAKLSFWADANLSIGPNHWHFDPREFIRHFRKCSWYSSDELSRCLPRRSLSGTVNWQTATERATHHLSSLNLFFRKYIGERRERHIHALSQIYIETGLLRLTLEDGSGTGKDYGPFYGRGYMQLTWAGNYERYGKFKNLLDQAHPIYADGRITGTSVHLWSDGGETKRWAPKFDPNVIGSDLMHSAESSGLYWVSKSFRGKKNINRACDLGVNGTSIGFISWLVNGGGNGYSNRQQFAEYLKNVLLDNEPLTGAATVHYPALTPPSNPTLCAQFPPVETPYNQQVTVYYERQIP